MHGKVRVIGLTGGIGCGKSTVAAILRELGAAVVDADEVARQVVAPGTPALAEIRDRFGAEVIGPDGQLDRKRLGQRVFADPEARRALNAITHPRIAEESRRAIAEFAAGGARVVVYEAALIVENQAYRWMDGLIVVNAPPELQLARLMAREGLAEPEARARIAAQATPEERAAVATFVIENHGSLPETRVQVERIWSEIEQSSAGGEA